MCENVQEKHTKCIPNIQYKLSIYTNKFLLFFLFFFFVHFHPLWTQTLESQTITAPNGVDGFTANNNDNDDHIIIPNGNKWKKFQSLLMPLLVRPNDSDESTESHSSNGHNDAHKWEMFEDNDSNEVNKNNRHRGGGDSDSGSHTNAIDIDGNSGILDEYDNNFPVDLSNDIAVNQMLADQGAPFNPDAEIFNVHEYDASAGGNSAENRQQQRQEQQQQQQQKQQQQQESQSYEYLPYYYVNQNGFNRQDNQFEKLSGDSSSSRHGDSSNDGIVRYDGYGSSSLKK